MAKNGGSKYTTVTVDTETQKKIGFLSHVMGKTQKQVMQEIFDNIFQLGSSYKKDLVLDYETVVSENTLTISFNGCSRLINASVSCLDDDSDVIADKRLKKSLTAQIKKKKALTA